MNLSQIIHYGFLKQNERIGTSGKLATNKPNKMNEKLFTPLFGFFLGLVSWESFQSIIYSLAIAFVGGIVAWLAKFLCDTLYKMFKNRNSK